MSLHRTAEPSTEEKRRVAALQQAAQGTGRDGAIVAALEDASPSVRELAIALAARHTPPETLGRLVGNDENAILRNAALAALERQGPYAVPHLMTLSRDVNVEVAMFAVQILARIKDPSSVEALLPLLEHADTNIVQAAIEALGNIKAREAVPGLLRLLSGDLWVQFAAVAALGEIGDSRAVGPLLDAVGNPMLAEPAVEALGLIAAPDSLPRLLALLADHDRLPLRDFVLRAVASICEKRAVPASVFNRFRRKLEEEVLEPSLLAYLGALLSSDEQELARAAACLVMSAQLKSLYPAVMLRALRPDPEEAKWTTSLCRRHERALRGSLFELLRHPDAQVRRGALLSLAFDEGSVPLVVARLSDGDAGVRAAACQALGRRRDTAAIPALIARFASGNAQESAAAAEALGSMPGQSLLLLAPYLEPEAGQDKVLATLGILEAAKSALFEDNVLDLLDAESAPIRRAALRVLANFDIDRAHEERLVRKLEDPDESVRSEAIELIVRSGSSRAAAVLIELLQVNDDLRYHAIRGLGRLHAAQAAGALEALFPRAGAHERIEIVAALIRIAAPGILPFLKARIAEPDTEIRRVAADGLARLATADELDLLVQLASDHDWNIRNHAGWGLGRIGLAEGRDTLLALVRDVDPVVARTARTALSKLPQQ